VDDADAALANTAWSEALLRLLDARRAQGLRTVVTASAAPERLAGLADLRTRLSAGAVYGLKALSDAERGEFLRDRARARGLELPADAAGYLLARLPRDAGSLTDAVDRLDRALLTAQRKLTLGFVQQWLRGN
jgi:DnaA family protein